jgi:type II secretory pathway component GspD/PulD (secretin)
MRAAPLVVLSLLALAVSSLGPPPATAQLHRRPDSTRGPISLTIRDAPIAEVYEMLARKQRVNVLIGRGVEGAVSVNLFEVSVDEAIRSIADAAGYVAERRPGGYVIIERDEAGKDAANANTIIRTFKVEYSDVSVVASVIREHLSRYGEITELPDRKLLVVEDLPDFVARIGQLLAELDKDPRQILIEAKVLEISLDDDQTYGVDWSGVFNVDDGMARVGVKDLAFKNAPGFFFDLMTSDIEVAINALADKGRVRTLSTPTLLALEYQEAEVVVGDRLGFRVTTTINQVTTESVEFLESGVILRFIASVDQRGRIVLSVHPEVSNGVISLDGLPNQTTTEVTTRFVTEDGQRVFIGGLIKTKELKNRSGVPYLMDVPILGYAFRRQTTTYQNTETIVILTAHLADEETPLIAAGKAKISDQSEQYLEKHRRRMYRYFDRSPFSFTDEPEAPFGDDPEPKSDVEAGPGPEAAGDEEPVESGEANPASAAPEPVPASVP